ncbi:MAG: hypothetical protein ACLP8S_24850 [Solirubrobacteraceae bacterium]
MALGFGEQWEVVDTQLAGGAEWLPEYEDPICLGEPACSASQMIEALLSAPERPDSGLAAIPDYPIDALPSAAQALVHHGSAGGLPAALIGGAALSALASYGAWT